MMAMKRRDVFVTVFLLALYLVTRLYLILHSHMPEYDLQSYRLLYEGWLSGLSPYTDPFMQDRYPYLPLWSWLMPPWVYLGRSMGLSLTLSSKLLVLAAEGGTLWILLRAWQRPSFSGFEKKRWAPVFGFILSPACLIISAGHGQFDAIAIFFIFLAAWESCRPEGARPGRLGLALGVAVGFKTWPLFFVPVLLRRLAPGARAWALLGALGVPLALLLPVVVRVGWAPVMSHLAYSGSNCLGLPEVIRYLSGGALRYQELWQWLALVFLAAFWAWSWLKVPGQLGPDLLEACLFLYLFAPGLSVQYLYWAMPFACISSIQKSWKVGLVTGLAVTVAYFVRYPEALLGTQFFTDRDPKDLQPNQELLWIWGNGLLWAWMLWEWELLAFPRPAVKAPSLV